MVFPVTVYGSVASRFKVKIMFVQCVVGGFCTPSVVLVGVDICTLQWTHFTLCVGMTVSSTV